MYFDGKHRLTSTVKIATQYFNTQPNTDVKVGKGLVNVHVFLGSHPCKVSMNIAVELNSLELSHTHTHVSGKQQQQKQQLVFFTVTLFLFSGLIIFCSCLIKTHDELQSDSTQNV